MTPKCPACKSKFSHDSGKLACKICGLPDEVRDQGGQAIARWKRKPYTVVGALDKVLRQSKRQRKLARVAGRQRGRNKHGRVGVKHATR